MPESAAEVARQHGLEPKAFRRALRARNFSWHQKGCRWNPPEGSPEHLDMVRLARSLQGAGGQSNAGHGLNSRNP